MSLSAKLYTMASNGHWYLSSPQRPRANSKKLAKSLMPSNSTHMKISDYVRSAPIYKAVMATLGTTRPFSHHVWHNHAPPWVKFFTWLLVHSRIQCKPNLENKTLLDENQCDICHTDSEAVDHIFLECPFVRQFRSSQLVSLTNNPRAATFWELHRPPQLPALHYSTVVLLCCWQIWKHRHDIAFCSMEPSLPCLLQQYSSDAVYRRLRPSLLMPGVPPSPPKCNFTSPNVKHSAWPVDGLF